MVTAITFKKLFKAIDYNFIVSFEGEVDFM